MYYSFFIFLHIVSVILAIGPLFIIIPVIRTLEKETVVTEREFKLPIKKAVWIVMHGGHLLVTTGVLLILFGPYPWHTSWVVLTVGVMVAFSYFLATGYSRPLKKYDSKLMTRKKLYSRLKRTTFLYITLMFVMLALMVFKPVFW